MTKTSRHQGGRTSTASHSKYNTSQAGQERYDRYRVSVKGILNVEAQYQKRARGELNAG